MRSTFLVTEMRSSVMMIPPSFSRVTTAIVSPDACYPDWPSWRFTVPTCRHWDSALQHVMTKITCYTVGKGHMCTPRSKWKHQFKKVQDTFYLRQEESLTSWIPTSKNVHSLMDEFGFSWLLSYFVWSSRLFLFSRKFRVSEIQHSSK